MNTITPTAPTAPAKPAKRKRKVALVAAALVGAASVGAYAYWTTGGNGTGTASTGDVVDVSLVQTSTVADLAPGLPAQDLEGTYTSLNDGPVYVDSITVAVSDVVDSADVSLGSACDADDYTITGSPITVQDEIVDGDTWSGATIEFNNKSAVNQDACKGATVKLSYTVN